MTGFSLVELIITTLMITIIAGAIGLSMHQAHNRSNSTKLTLALQQEKNDVLSLLRKELPNATELTDCLTDSITLQIPDMLNVNNGEPVPVNYQWDDITNILYRSDNLYTSTVVSDEVYYFFIEYNIYPSGFFIYARGVAITLQIGPSTENRFTTFYEFYNHPKMPG
ncbi:MAG: hypothetical protein GY869_14430 [Planctomycetes bacterium]|nr:hypothetical protein [Planctomycetota bacterium]